MCPGGSYRAIEVPKVDDCLQPVVNIVPLQVRKLEAKYPISHNFSFL